MSYDYESPVTGVRPSQIPKQAIRLHGVIFVIDLSRWDQVKEARDFLKTLIMNHEYVQGRSFLVIRSKTDRLVTGQCPITTNERKLHASLEIDILNNMQTKTNTEATLIN